MLKKSVFRDKEEEEGKQRIKKVTRFSMSASDRLRKLKELREIRSQSQSPASPMFDTRPNAAVVKSVPTSQGLAASHSTSTGKELLAAALASSCPVKGGSSKQATLRPPIPLTPVPLDGPQDNLWRSVAQQAAEEYQMKEAHRKAITLAKLTEQRRFLQEQIAERDAAKKKRKEEGIRDRDQVEEERKKWVAAEEAKARKRHEEQEALEKERKSQMEYREELHRQELEAKRRAEIALAYQSELYDQEQQSIKERRMKEREQLKEDLDAANRANLQAKHQRKENEEAADRAIEEEYLRRSAQEEERRERALQSTKRKAAQRDGVAAQNLAAEQERMRLEEERNEQLAIRREQEELAREQEKQRKKQLALDVTLRLQAKQIQERTRMREMIAEKRIEERLESEKEVKEAEAARRLEQQKLAEKRQREKEAIVEQIKFRTKLQYVVMSEDEMKLNKEILGRTIGELPRLTPDQLGRMSPY